MKLNRRLDQFQDFFFVSATATHMTMKSVLVIQTLAELTRRCESKHPSPTNYLTKHAPAAL